MIRLLSRVGTLSMGPHIAPKGWNIPHFTSLIGVKRQLVSVSQFSSSHSQEQALATITTEAPTLSVSPEDLLSRTGIFHADLQEQVQAPSTIATQTPMLRPSTEDLASSIALDVSLQERGQAMPMIHMKNHVLASRDPYWQKIPHWRDVSEKDFLDYQWQSDNAVQGKARLLKFLISALPKEIVPKPSSPFEHIRTREDFIKDVFEGIAIAPMSIRLSPHTLSVIDWTRALEDPIRRQFLPMKSSALPDHPMLTLDSLNEKGDSPVDGLVHRYPDKALFLATSVCPVYCRFCTRSYAVGGSTDTVSKDSLRPVKKRWETMFKYIEDTTTLRDIVVSGGDSYLLSPNQLYDIGVRLISFKHIRRFRFASKGLAVCPSRIIDPTDDWASALIEVSKLGKIKGKEVALHTHFNHPNEITWVTALAAERLFKEGVIVRNQSVLLRGVNDNLETMSSLIRDLADINIQPYYVYQGDMVKGVEDLRTPLQTSLDLEAQIRGSIAGFMMPQFIVDLPGGGGKRLAASYETYDRVSGISTFIAPAVSRRKDKADKVYEYYDPDWSIKA